MSRLTGQQITDLARFAVKAGKPGALPDIFEQWARDMEAECASLRADRDALSAALRDAEAAQSAIRADYERQMRGGDIGWG